jgi:hypothetical protein
MEVTFELTLEDYVDFNMHAVDNTSVGRDIRRKAVIVGPVVYMPFAIIGLIVALTSTDLKVKLAATFGCVLFTIASALWPILYPKLQKVAVTRNVRRMLGELQSGSSGITRLALDAHGVHLQSPTRETSVKWEAVSYISRGATADYLFFGMATAFLVPHRAFADEQERESFLTLAQELRAAATAAQPTSH